jgi:hypothetical protein
VCAAGLVRRIRALEPGHDRGHLVARLGQRHAAREAPERQDGMRVSRQLLDVGRHRQPDVHARSGVPVGEPASVVGRGEPLQHARVGRVRQDANDGPKALVEPYGATDDLSVVPADLRAHPLADHHDIVASRSVLDGGEEPALQRPGAQHRQQIGGDVQACEPAWFPARRRQVELVRDESPECVDSPRLLPQVEQVGQRGRLTDGAAVSVRLPHGDDAIGVRIGERFHEHGIHHAEDGCRGADAQCDRQHCGSRESPAARQQPVREAQLTRDTRPHARLLQNRRMR